MIVNLIMNSLQHIRKTITIFLLSLIGIFLAFPSYSAECRRAASVCVEGGETRNINGQPVWRDCWKYQDTFECTKPDSTDYCAGIKQVAGCNQINSVCTQYAFNGQCLNYQNTYGCGDQVTPPAGTVQLDTTYTVTTDSIDRAQCGALESNKTCKLAENICVEPGGTRIINGLPVTKDCWKWEETYSCIAQDYMNYCTPLRQEDSCKVVEQKCLSTAWDGSCNEYEQIFRCGDRQGEPLPEKVEYLKTEYTVVKDQVNTVQCDEHKNNPNCTLAERVCTQGPETRTIEGVPIYKDCWEWTENYACASEKLKDDCGDLSANPACQEASSTCVDTLPGGQCGLNERKFQCKVSEGKTEEIVSCDNGVCVNGICNGPQTNPDSDFANVVTALEAARQMGEYFDRETSELFKGVAADCSIKLGGLSNCCKAKGGGGGQSNAVMMAGVKMIGNEAVRFLGSPYMYDALYSMDLVPSSVLAAIYGPEKILQSGSDFVFGEGGGLSFYGITYVPGASPPFAFDPYSFAIAIALQVIQQYLACSQDEQLLGMRKDQRLCTYVGSWCSRKVFGACITKKEGYCCYNSRLARIFNEQGRAQLGKVYGSAKNPDCSGFTMSDLEKLDMSKMDLSEFIQDVIPKDLDTGKLTERATQTIQDRSTNYFNQK